MHVKETRIPAQDVRSLIWDKGTLIDWAGGGRRFLLSGETQERHVRYAYPFDAAVSSPSGEFSVIYTRLGTKGLVLHRGEIVREINRSYYHADVYEYPVTLGRLYDGREIVIHCPDDYCRLEIEELSSGKRLTYGDKREPSDFFHSRLAVSPNGRSLVSAGWVWHPVDAVQAYDLQAAIENPAHFDGDGRDIRGDAWAESSSAAFFQDNRLAVALNGIEQEDGSIESSYSELRIFDLESSTVPSIVRVPEMVGTMMPVGNNHVLALYNHPRLIDLRTGNDVQNWPHIKSGAQISSILMSMKLPPPMAFDVISQRCAIADSEGITVLEFSTDAS